MNRKQRRSQKKTKQTKRGTTMNFENVDIGVVSDDFLKSNMASEEEVEKYCKSLSVDELLEFHKILVYCESKGIEYIQQNFEC